MGAGLNLLMPSCRMSKPRLGEFNVSVVLMVKTNPAAFPCANISVFPYVKIFARHFPVLHGSRNSELKQSVIGQISWLHDGLRERPGAHPGEKLTCALILLGSDCV
jgi:hypothetical protein